MVRTRIIDADFFCSLRIENHDVCVCTHGNRTLLGEQSESFSRRRRGHLNKTIQIHSPFNHPAVVDKAHPVFNARRAVRNLGEGIQAQLFLLFKAEWAMVCGYRLQVSELKPLPKLVLIPLLPKRWGHHPLRALKSLFFIIARIKEEILRTGFRNNVHAALACPFYLL